MQRRFRQVDVFTSTPYFGNPLAVVVDGEGLDDGEMARFANWTNLSETTFLCPPTDPSADYRARIFTPTGELPFAGHPTLGSAHVWLETGGTPKREDVIVQECGVGLVEIRRTAHGLAFVAPPLIRSGPVDEADLDRVAAALGVGRDEIVDAAWADNGPGWVAVLLESAEAVLRVRPSAAPVPIGVVGFEPDGDGAAYQVRAFIDFNGQVVEDPVTGSLNASVAQWLIGSGRTTPPYVAAQGTALGREGRVHVDRTADGRIWIGGQVAASISGTVEL
jgi:PhzF family phenazine biosynthesis protein